jgi:hypothetical protein
MELLKLDWKTPRVVHQWARFAQWKLEEDDLLFVSGTRAFAPIISEFQFAIVASSGKIALRISAAFSRGSSWWSEGVWWLLAVYTAHQIPHDLMMTWR